MQLDPIFKAIHKITVHYQLFNQTWKLDVGCRYLLNTYLLLGFLDILCIFWPSKQRVFSINYISLPSFLRLLTKYVANILMKLWTVTRVKNWMKKRSNSKNQVLTHEFWISLCYYIIRQFLRTYKIKQVFVLTKHIFVKSYQIMPFQFSSQSPKLSKKRSTWTFFDVPSIYVQTHSFSSSKIWQCNLNFPTIFCIRHCYLCEYDKNRSFIKFVYIHILFEMFHILKELNK